MKHYLKIGLAAALILPSTAIANDKWEQQVRTQLSFVQSMFEDDGYTRRGSVTVDSMTDDEVDNFTMTLSKGTSYTVIGVCDEDCGDIDLWIYDEYDNELAKDVSNDDVPMVSLNPNRTAEYRLKVRMYDCDSEPCFHGFVVMQD